MQLEIFAELQPPVSVRQRHRSLDVVGDRFSGGVREIVERQDDDVVADADASVLAAVAEKFRALRGLAGHSYHLFVLTLWTWA
jgi:hypothetical protein